MIAKSKRLVTFDRLLPEFGITDSRTTIRRKMKANPPQFPQCVRSGSGARIAWYEGEIAAHVASLERGAAHDYRTKAKAKAEGGGSPEAGGANG